MSNVATNRLEFGRDVLCRRCNGTGGEHAFHVEEVTQLKIEGGTKRITKHRPCTEHPCPACAGAGTVALGRIG